MFIGLNTCLKIARSDAAQLLEEDDEEDFEDDDFDEVFEDDLLDELVAAPGPSGSSNAKIMS